MAAKKKAKVAVKPKRKVAKAEAVESVYLNLPKAEAEFLSDVAALAKLSLDVVVSVLLASTIVIAENSVRGNRRGGGVRSR